MPLPSLLCPCPTPLFSPSVVLLKVTSYSFLVGPFCVCLLSSPPFLHDLALWRSLRLFPPSQCDLELIPSQSRDFLVCSQIPSPITILSPLSSKTKCALARIAVFTPFLHRFIELSIALASCAGEWVFIAGFLRWHVPSSGHAIQPAHNVPSPHTVSPSWSSGSGVL